MPYPKVYDALEVEDKDITLEVQQQLGDGVVRTIALGSTDGLQSRSERQIPVQLFSIPVGQRHLVAS